MAVSLSSFRKTPSNPHPISHILRSNNMNCIHVSSFLKDCISEFQNHLRPAIAVLFLSWDTFFPTLHIASQISLYPLYCRSYIQISHSLQSKHSIHGFSGFSCRLQNVFHRLIAVQTLSLHLLLDELPESFIWIVQIKLFSGFLILHQLPCSREVMISHFTCLSCPLFQGKGLINQFRNLLIMHFIPNPYLPVSKFLL